MYKNQGVRKRKKPSHVHRWYYSRLKWIPENRSHSFPLSDSHSFFVFFFLHPFLAIGIPDCILPTRATHIKLIKVRRFIGGVYCTSLWSAEEEGFGERAYASGSAMLIVICSSFLPSLSLLPSTALLHSSELILILVLPDCFTQTAWPPKYPANLALLRINHHLAAALVYDGDGILALIVSKLLGANQLAEEFKQLGGDKLWKN